MDGWCVCGACSPGLVATTTGGGIFFQGSNLTLPGLLPACLERGLSQLLQGREGCPGSGHLDAQGQHY